MKRELCRYPPSFQMSVCEAPWARKEKTGSSNASRKVSIDVEDASCVDGFSEYNLYDTMFPLVG